MPHLFQPRLIGRCTYAHLRSVEKQHDISIKFSSESLGSQWKNVCLQLPRHHPNYNIPTFQPPQADHFWHAGEPTPRLSSSFTGGGNRGSSIREQSKMIQSWKQRTGCFRFDYIFILDYMIGTVFQYADVCSPKMHHPGNQRHLTKSLREVSLLFF